LISGPTLADFYDIAIELNCDAYLHNVCEDSAKYRGAEQLIRFIVWYDLEQLVVTRAQIAYAITSRTHTHHGVRQTKKHFQKKKSWIYNTEIYRADYNNRPPSAVSFMPAIASTSGRLRSEFVRLLFLQAHRETDRFFAASGVQLAQTQRGLFHFRCAAFSDQIKAKVGSTLAKTAALRINLNIDGAPITSRTHTHPSHSQTSRLLTSSLSLGVPVPRATQCMRGA
jgi:hypothetical protein